MKIDWEALYREACDKQLAIRARLLSEYPEAEWKRGCYVDNYPPRVVIYLVNSGINLREREAIGDWVGKLAMEFDMSARPEFNQTVIEDFRGLDRLAYSLHPKRDRPEIEEE